jgi:hypothetical protein
MRNLAGGRGPGGRRLPGGGEWGEPERFGAPRHRRSIAAGAEDFDELPYTRLAAAQQAYADDEDVPRSRSHGADLPRLRRKRSGFAPLVVSCFAFVSFGVGLAVLAAAQSADAPAETARLETPTPPQWIDVVRPFELFSLTTPDLAKYTKFYQARRHRDGGGRQDILGFGELKGEDPFLRLMVYRPGSESVTKAPFFVDMVRSAAAAELSIGHNLQPQESMTRFGLFEIADVDLVDKTGTASPCLAFRSAAGDAPVKIIGFACGNGTKPLSQPALVCLIERLDLNSAGEDQTLSRFFADAELKRNPACAGSALAPTPVRANWLDQADAPPQLKLRKTH